MKTKTEVKIKEAELDHLEKVASHVDELIYAGWKEYQGKPITAYRVEIANKIVAVRVEIAKININAAFNKAKMNNILVDTFPFLLPYFILSICMVSVLLIISLF